RAYARRVGRGRTIAGSRAPPETVWGAPACGPTPDILLFRLRTVAASGLSGFNAHMLRLSRSALSRHSTPALLAIAIPCLYVAIGPGRFFSVDEVAVEATARAVYSRHNLEVSAMNTVVPGREGAYYAGHRGPALGYVVLPFVVAGDFLDNRFGSLKGGVAAGPALGTLEHPLRWGGRLSIFFALLANSIIAGFTVSLL